MTFLEFCEAYSGHPLCNWQKEYALAMEKRINELKARVKSGEDIVIRMPRGSVKTSPLYYWFLYEYANKEADNDKRRS